MKPPFFLLGIALSFLFIGCGKPLPPHYVGYQNFRLEKIGLKQNVLATDIKLYNPNKYNLKLKSAALDVYFNNDLLGRSTLDSLIVLTAKDTALIPLRLAASAKDILANTAKLLLNPDVKIRLNGTARVGRGAFFITVPIDYEGTQRIDLRELITSFKE